MIHRPFWLTLSADNFARNILIKILEINLDIAPAVSDNPVT